MAALRKLRGRIYYLDFRDENGVRRRVRGSSDKEVAKEMLRSKLVEVDRIRAGLEDRVKHETRIADLFLQYLDDLKLRAAPATYGLHKYVIELIQPRLRVQRVREMGPTVLTPVMETFIAKGLSNRTVNIYIGIIRRVFRWATDSNLISRNPVERMRPLKVVKTRHRRAMTEPEIEALLSACDEELRMFVELLLETGLRRGEAVGLEWRDVDLDHASLTVRAEIAKSKRERSIPLRLDMVEELKAWRDRHPSASPQSPVFVSGEGNRMKANLNRRFRRALKRSKVDPTGVDIHSLRYCFATRLCKAGISPKVAQILLGHRDIRLTMDLYTDATLLDRRGAVDALPPLPRPQVSGGVEPKRKAG